jgi:hypothetical protein
VRFWANGFRSSVIPGWNDRSTITLVGPTSQNGFATNIVVTRQEITEHSASAFAKVQLKLLADEAHHIEILDERTTTLAGMQIYQRLHLIDIGGQIIQQVQTYLVQQLNSSATGFVITCSATPEDFTRHLPAFRQFTEEFRFFDPDTGEPN